MKRYIRGGVTLSESYVGIINYNSQPIGYLAAKQPVDSLVVQIDPTDLTKAHGLAIGSKRSIQGKYKYVENGYTSITIMDGKRQLGRYFDIDDPTYYIYSRSGSASKEFALTEELIELEDKITLDIVPAETDITFTKLEYVANIHPSLSECVTYLREIENCHGWDFIKAILRNNHVTQLVRNGILYYVDKYPQHVFEIVEWCDKYGLWNKLPKEVEMVFRDITKDESNSPDSWIDSHLDEIEDYIEHAPGDRIANLEFDVSRFLREHKDEIPYSDDIFNKLKDTFIDILDKTNLRDYEIETKNSESYSWR